MNRTIDLTLALTLGLAPTLTPLAALACSSAPPKFDGGATGGLEGGVSISVGRIAGLVWVPLVIDGVAVPEGSELWLKMSFDGKVEGGTGCNRFTGKADLDAGVMQFGPLAVTEMACADPARMAREAAWLKALTEVRWFVAAPEGLWLQRADGSVAVCLG
jgi:heat shock protein HslJ